MHNYKTAANYKLLSLQAIFKIKYDVKIKVSLTANIQLNTRLPQ